MSYLPTAPGEYKISARFAGDHIEGSPFTCKVTGEGKKRNAISVGSASELSLPENISDYDLRSLNAYIGNIRIILALKNVKQFSFNTGCFFEMCPHMRILEKVYFFMFIH